MPVRRGRVGQGARLQRGGRMDRPPVLRRDRQLHRLRPEDEPAHRVRLPEDRHRHRRPAQRQLEEAQVPRQVTARSGLGVPVLPGLRCRPQLLAERCAQGTSQTAQARPEGPLVLYPHATEGPPCQWAVRRSEDTAHTQGLFEPTPPARRGAFHHLQEAPLLHLQQSVLSVGHL